jgi:hypothetical protein
VTERSTTRLEIRNLDPDLIRRYLIEEMDGTLEGTDVRGEGWLVRFTSKEPVNVGLMKVRVLFLDVEGEREGEVARFLRQKTMRGGG